MSPPRKVDSKEVGLVIGMILGKYFLNTEDLHYGYWPPGLPVSGANMAQAQANYSKFLISHIPAGTKTILDVGCGTGHLARQLLGLGYRVDCVSPSPLLTERARQKLGDACRIFECTYEEVETGKPYDLVLFSESWQYVKMEPSFQKTQTLLPEGGHLLICDFFKTDAKGKSALGGGHRLSKFYRLISSYPFAAVQDLDLTPETAPNLALVDEVLTRAGIPIRDLVFYFLNQNYPRLSKLVQWQFQKKIDKLNFKYFSGQRNAENFAKFKSYRLLLYQKVAAGEGIQ
jgi:SAM-dependent methyltransferase